MTYSEQAQGIVAYKVQSALGTAASGSGGLLLRTTGGGGGKMTMAAVESAEVRQDAMSTRGRHGSQKTAGAYDTELSLGNIDTILEAVMRGTWGAADLTKTQADFTSLTTGANTIILASSSPITLGLRVGDVIRLLTQDAGNNGRNLRITGLSATTITVAETLTVNAVADTSCSIIRPGRVLINPAAGALVKRYFTIDEYEINIDGSEVFQDAVWSGITFSMAPNGMFMANPSWTGNGQFTTATTGSAPTLTSPTATTGLPMAAIDATLRLGTGDVVDITSFSLTLDTSPSSPDVVASRYAPDVFLGSNVISMNLGMLRSDLLDVADFIAETQLSLSVLIAEPSASTEDFISIYVPNFTYGSVDKSALAKAGGPLTQTISVPNALIGKDDTGGAFDATMIKVQVSNAT